MAKNVYKIPSSMDRSFLDHEIIFNVSGWQAKPLALKVVLFWVGSIFGLFWVLSSTFLKDANFGAQFLLVVWWLLATAFLGSYSQTKEMRFSSLPALLDYVPKSARRVVTRSSANPSQFYSIVGIDRVDETGIIHWGDGSIGQAYLVVGTSSVLLFAQDKEAILNRVDSFYRKIDTTAELIWLTTKEPQRVLRQLAHLERRNRALEPRDPELVELLHEQYSVLTDFVGGSFNSIHQYLVIKADNYEALKRAHTIVCAEREESGLMLKQLTILDRADALEMFRSVYATAR